MSVRAYYENEVAEKQLKELNLFEAAKIKGYVNYKAGNVCIDGDILSGLDSYGKVTGKSDSLVKAIVIEQLKKVAEKS